MYHRIKFSILFLSLLILSDTPLFSQDNLPHNTLRIDATGTVFLPADLVQFRISIRETGSSAKSAFESHKEKESFLTNLLLSEEIPDSNIVVSPIRITDVNRPDSEKTRYQTSQEVSIQLHDLDQFEQMQITLIENGFGNFSGSFTALKVKEASDDALRKAIEVAKEKAEILADASNRDLHIISRIDYSSGSNISPRMSRTVSVAYDESSGSLLQFQQQVPVRESVTVYFLMR